MVRLAFGLSNTCHKLEEPIVRGSKLGNNVHLWTRYKQNIELDVSTQHLASSYHCHRSELFFKTNLLLTLRFLWFIRKLINGCCNFSSEAHCTVYFHQLIVLNPKHYCIQVIPNEANHKNCKSCTTSSLLFNKVISVPIISIHMAA